MERIVASLYQHMSPAMTQALCKSWVQLLHAIAIDSACISPQWRTTGLCANEVGLSRLLVPPGPASGPGALGYSKVSGVLYWAHSIISEALLASIAPPGHDKLHAQLQQLHMPIHQQQQHGRLQESGPAERSNAPTASQQALHVSHAVSWQHKQHWHSSLHRLPALQLLLSSPAAITAATAGHHHWQQQRYYHSQPNERHQQQAAANSGRPQATTQQLALQQQQQQPQRDPGAAWTSLPNLLSLSRVASGPWVAYLIATQQWPLAVGLTAIAGVTDWLDGYLARQMKHTSKLGSYLDPLADKVLIGSVVGTMGCLGMVPGWLAVVVVGRDVAQVGGMTWYRLRMFGGRWPGAAAFFDVDGTAAAAVASHQGTAIGDRPSGAGPSSVDNAASSTGVSSGLPQMRPLMVSKLNTALVFVLIAGCVSQQWQGVPGQDVLDLLEYTIAATTAVSTVAYVRLYKAGKLLPAAKAQ